jgi:hypothetical protein
VGGGAGWPLESFTVKTMLNLCQTHMKRHIGNCGFENFSEGPMSFE